VVKQRTSPADALRVARETEETLSVKAGMEAHVGQSCEGWLEGWYQG